MTIFGTCKDQRDEKPPQKLNKTLSLTSHVARLEMVTDINATKMVRLAARNFQALAKWAT